MDKTTLVVDSSLDLDKSKVMKALQSVKTGNNQSKILYITPNRTLMEYLEPMYGPVATPSFIDKSLFLLLDRHTYQLDCDVLVLEESDQILRRLLLSPCCGDRETYFLKFFELVKNAKHLIISQYHLGNLTFKFLELLNRTNKVMSSFLEKENSLQVDSKEELILRIENCLSRNLKCLIFSNTKILVDDAYKRIMPRLKENFRKKNFLNVKSFSVNEPYSTRLLNNPKQEAAFWDCVLIKSVEEDEIEVVITDQIFDESFIFFDTDTSIKTQSLTSFLQKVSYGRDPKSISYFSKSIVPKSLEQGLCQALAESDKTSLSFREGFSPDITIGELTFEFSNFVNLKAEAYVMV